jgi:methionine synthase II (cobalamin-independent)
MSYVAREARQELLDDIAAAIERLAAALADLGVAYEQLDEQSADRLEEALFRPVQTAYGRARRTHAGFAQRHGLPGREFAPAAVPTLAHATRELVDRALEAVEAADAILADLQDSMRPVEVGDAELRAGLADVRGRLGPLPEAARAFTRTLGR